MSKIIYLADRSGCETDDDCGYSYWLNRKAGPGRKGIVQAVESIYLAIGRESHEDLHAIAEIEDLSPLSIDTRISEITESLTEEDKKDQKTMEILYRRLGWFAAFALFIEPKLREEFDTISVEDELILDRSPLWVAVTPDRVLRSKKSGKLIYQEYKSTITASNKWTSSWPFAIQLHLGMKAIEEELKEPIGFSRVVGLMKGDYYGTRHNLTHPYVWAYQNSRTGEWTHEYSKSRSPEWNPAPVWDYPGGVVGWVQLLGEDIAKGQFPMSQPIFLNERMLDQWVTSRTWREAEIAAVSEECYENPLIRARYFRRETKRCRPGFGDQCQYLSACWNASVSDDPIRSGLYVERTPHHMVEVLFDKENSDAENTVQ